MKKINGKKVWLLILMVALGSGITSCKREDDPQKFIHGVPVNPQGEITEARLIQDFHAALKASLQTVVPVANRLGRTISFFPEITGGPDAQSRYTMNASDLRVGTIPLTVQFRDQTNSVIDPISNLVSTSSVKFVLVSGTGASDRFAITLNYTITFQTAGDEDSDKFLSDTTGLTSQLSGQGVAMVMTLNANPFVTENGVKGGVVVGLGTGVNSVVVGFRLKYSSDLGADGSLTRQGISDPIKLLSNGRLMVISDNSKIFFD